MGLLNFFSKKSHPDLRRASLKTSAYNLTVASSPPVRGQYPVVGNGAKILEEFTKSHPDLVAVPQYNAPAPSPLVPRFHGDDLHNSNLERPSTAPSNQLDRTRSTPDLIQSQPKSDLPQPPKKKYGPYKLPPKIAADIRASSPSAKPALSPGLVSSYTSSIRSGGSAKSKSHVDLLDAHSTIKPADFYGRVQAAGARNYGEDVADRNIEGNGSSIHRVQPQEPLSKRTDTNRMSLVSKEVNNDPNGGPPQHPKIRHSMGSGLRSKYASSHTSDYSFPKRTTSRLPLHYTDEIPEPMAGTSSARSERASRRKSMSYLALASGETPRTSLAGRGGEEEDGGLFRRPLRGCAAAAHEREYVQPTTVNNRHSIAYSHIEHQPRHTRNDSEQTLPDRPRSKRDNSRQRAISHSRSVMDTRIPLRRQSLQRMRPGSRGEVYEDTFQTRTSQGSQFSRDRNSSRRQLGSTTNLRDSFYNSPAQQPDHKSEMMASSANDTDSKGKSTDMRKQSILSLSNKSIMAQEIENSIPERTSSLRHGSLTSETAMSTMSSNPFRPQSGHTTNTSVDFTPMSPNAYSDQSIPPVPDIPLATSSQSRPKRIPAIPSPAHSYTTAYTHQSNKFVLEDYASSDGSRSPSPSRGSYEKDLLFSEESYRSELPGLPGLGASDAAVPNSSAGPSAGRALQNELQSIFSQFQMPAYVHSDSDDSFDNRGRTDSSDDFLNFDIPTSRAGSRLRHTRGTQVRSRARRHPIEEEDDSSDY